MTPFIFKFMFLTEISQYLLALAEKRSEKRRQNSQEKAKTRLLQALCPSFAIH